MCLAILQRNIGHVVIKTVYRLDWVKIYPILFSLTIYPFSHAAATYPYSSTSFYKSASYGKETKVDATTLGTARAVLAVGRCDSAVKAFIVSNNIFMPYRILVQRIILDITPISCILVDTIYHWQNSVRQSLARIVLKASGYGFSQMPAQNLQIYRLHTAHMHV